MCCELNIPDLISSVIFLNDKIWLENICPFLQKQKYLKCDFLYIHFKFRDNSFV